MAAPVRRKRLSGPSGVACSAVAALVRTVWWGMGAAGAGVLQRALQLGAAAAGARAGRDAHLRGLRAPSAPHAPHPGPSPITATRAPPDALLASPKSEPCRESQHSPPPPPARVFSRTSLSRCSPQAPVSAARNAFANTRYRQPPQPAFWSNEPIHAAHARCTLFSSIPQALTCAALAAPGAQRRHRWSVSDAILRRARPAKPSRPSVVLDIDRAAGPGEPGGPHTIVEQLRAQLGDQSKRLGGDKWWGVTYKGSPGVDAGGLFRDSLSRVSAELCSPAQASAPSAQPGVSFAPRPNPPI
jgi:hypothetical protein